MVVQQFAWQCSELLRNAFLCSISSTTSNKRANDWTTHRSDDRRNTIEGIGTGVLVLPQKLSGATKCGWKDAEWRYRQQRAPACSGTLRNAQKCFPRQHFLGRCQQARRRLVSAPFGRSKEYDQGNRYWRSSSVAETKRIRGTRMEECRMAASTTAGSGMLRNVKKYSDTLSSAAFPQPLSTSAPTNGERTAWTIKQNI